MVNFQFQAPGAGLLQTARELMPGCAQLISVSQQQKPINMSCFDSMETTTNSNDSGSASFVPFGSRPTRNSTEALSPMMEASIRSPPAEVSYHCQSLTAALRNSDVS
eukprot:scaffold7418_cov40-Prasinocladus_malaysianus.AAC.1